MRVSSISFFLIFIVFFSCSGLRTINISMLQPGAVSFPSNVHTIVLLNRANTLETKANKIESIITGEGHNQDKQGRQHVLAAIHATMANSPRIKYYLSDQEVIGNSTGTLFPSMLGWDTIAMLCKQYNTQAVLALETYDSDCIITHESGNVQVNNQFGIPIPRVQLFVTQKIIIKLGFRIYDFANKQIIDQYNYTYHHTYNSQANSIGEIMSGVLDRSLVINQTSSEAGEYLKSHISPTWGSEIRSLYTKSGSSPMAIGGRQAMLGNWDEAKINWKKVIDSAPKRKLAGKVCYNLALASEIKGDFDGARDWISKSYGNFGNNHALTYQNIINRRYSQIGKLDQQMK